jgi:hypothetical protein
MLDVTSICTTVVKSACSLILVWLGLRVGWFGLVISQNQTTTTL